MRRARFLGTRFGGGGAIAVTSQAAVEKMERLPGADVTSSGSAKVTKVHPDRMTVDVLTWNGAQMKNVPVLTNAGLNANGEVFGTLELPPVDTYVLVAFVGDREGFPVVIGNLFPYAASKYQSGQTTAKSTNKAFTKKLLEDVTQPIYRKILESGTTIEVDNKGSLTVETPSGSYFQIDETNKKVTISLKDGTVKGKIEMTGTSTKINDNLEVLL